MLELHICTFNFSIVGFMQTEKRGQIKVETFKEENAETKAADTLREEKIFLPYEKLKLELIEKKTVAV